MTQHDTPAPATHAEPPSRRRGLRTTIALLGVLAVGGVGASALWSDTAQVETTVTSGSFDINVDGDQGNPIPYALPIDLSNVTPEGTYETSITINNTGTEDAYVQMAYDSAGSRAATAAMGIPTDGFSAMPFSKRLKAAMASTDHPISGGASVLLLGSSFRTGDPTTTPATPPLKAGESMQVDLSFTLPVDNSSDLQGKSEAILYKITASQYQP